MSTNVDAHNYKFSFFFKSKLELDHLEGDKTGQFIVPDASVLYLGNRFLQTYVRAGLLITSRGKAVFPATVHSEARIEVQGGLEGIEHFNVRKELRLLKSGFTENNSSLPGFYQFISLVIKDGANLHVTGSYSTKDATLVVQTKKFVLQHRSAVNVVRSLYMFGTKMSTEKKSQIIGDGRGTYTTV